MKKDKGITIISLVITIIVMLILISITIGSIKDSKNTVNEAKDSKKRLELQEVQQIVFENYIKYKQTGNEDYLIGTQVNSEELMTYKEEIDSYYKQLESNHEEFEFLDEDYKNYYKIDDNEKLNKLGLQSTIKEYDQNSISDEAEENTMDKYLVNYKTGEVYNYTTKKTKEGTILYVRGNE